MGSYIYLVCVFFPAVSNCKIADYLSGGVEEPPVFEPHCMWVNHKVALVKQLYGSAAETQHKVLAKTDRQERWGGFILTIAGNPSACAWQISKNLGAHGSNFRKLNFFT